jgi:hypothetical protein
MSHGVWTLRTPERRAEFIRLLREGNAIGAAATAIGCNRRTMYDWRNADAEFRAEWEDALEHQTEEIESVVYRKAKDGDLLACCVWLRAHKPGLYHRRQLLSIEGSLDHQHTLNAEDAASDAKEVVHFYLPANRRDEPEREVPKVIDATYEVSDDTSDDTSDTEAT